VLFYPSIGVTETTSEFFYPLCMEAKKTKRLQTMFLTQPTMTTEEQNFQ